MIINKIVVGYVLQQFDTAKHQFISQEFLASDEVTWETQDGERLKLSEKKNVELVCGKGGIKEPYLSFEMIQPSHQVPPLLPDLFAFRVGDTVLVLPNDGLDTISDPIQHEFIGTVIGIKDNKYITVEDQDGESFDCDPIQLHHAMS